MILNNTHNCLLGVLVSVHAAAALKDENASFGIWGFMTRTVVTSGLKRMLSQTLGEAGSFLLFSWPCRV